jgi:hypothetical protein
MQVRILPSTPPRRSSVVRAPPSEGGGRTFESCRRGPCTSSRKRPGRMRSLSRTQVGVAPLGVRVAPLPPPPHAAMVQRSRHRALNSEIGVRFPVAVLSCSSNNVAISVPGSRTARRPAVTRKVGVRAPPWQPPPGGRGSRRTAADRVTGVKVPPGRPSHTRTHNLATQVVVVQRRGSRHATPGMRVRIPPATRTSNTPAGEVLTARTLAS